MSASKKDVHASFIDNLDSIRATKEWEEMDPEEREEMEGLYEISKKRVKSREYEKKVEEQKKKEPVKEEPEEESEEEQPPLAKAFEKIGKSKKAKSSIDIGSVAVLAGIGYGLYWMFSDNTPSKVETKKEEVISESK